MLQTPPLFFKTWFMVLISFSIIFVLALGFGLLIKLVLKSSWYSFTFTAILLTLYGLPYYLNEYKYSYTIYIPDHYVGNVRLFLSRNNKNDLFINDFGIGYISYRTFNKGFMPTIVKNRSDITNQIDGMGKGIYPANFNEKYVLDHLKFTVPGATENREVVDFDQLVIQNAIDTSRLQRK